jgi:hypothetical protein
MRSIGNACSNFKAFSLLLLRCRRRWSEAVLFSIPASFACRVPAVMECCAKLSSRLYAHGENALGASQCGDECDAGCLAQLGRGCTAVSPVTMLISHNSRLAARTPEC